MKYQFQFAGANVSRRSSQPRKRLRIAVLVGALILAGLAYWQYLQHLTHNSHRVVSNVTSAAKTTATATATTAAATATTATAATVKATSSAAATESAKKAAPATPATAKATKTVATTTATTAATKLLTQPEAATPVTSTKAAESSPSTTATSAPSTTAATATTAETAPDAKPHVTQVTHSAPTATPVIEISSEPPTHRQRTRVHTPEERLKMAGTTAFNNMLDMAKKYPDAYGFRAEDTFKKATLGDPLPIYSIDEADRAKYKSGQPIKPLLKPSDTWVFPVRVGDRVCCMVQVHYDGHSYVPENGSKLLGIAWDKITKKWPKSKGYHPCIVVNPGIPGYFFTVPGLSKPNMTDIIRLSSFHPSLSPADVILASWR